MAGPRAGRHYYRTAATRDPHATLSRSHGAGISTLKEALDSAEIARIRDSFGAQTMMADPRRRIERMCPRGYDPASKPRSFPARCSSKAFGIGF